MNTFGPEDKWITTLAVEDNELIGMAKRGYYNESLDILLGHAKNLGVRWLSIGPKDLVVFEGLTVPRQWLSPEPMAWALARLMGGMTCGNDNQAQINYLFDVGPLNYGTYNVATGVCEAGYLELGKFSIAKVAQKWETCPPVVTNAWFY